jgi:UDP-N-acetyl-D-glucosamine dehydrogenase
VNQIAFELADRLGQRKSVSAVVGLGYVGLPLAIELANAGYDVVGLDLSGSIVAGINGGRSHIQDVPDALVQQHVRDGRLRATTDPSVLAQCDTICVCVPTPLNKIKDPDLSFVIAVAESIREYVRPGQLIILESTTYPGTTREVFLPILERSGLRLDEDFFVCFSPERVDPGNTTWHTQNTPKVIGGVSQLSLEIGLAFYGSVFETMVPVESAEAAELVKVYENTFRMVNIALANEMALTCDRLGLDVWGVIEAAATKPFGFMKFTPGPGLGGHCIPLDPHYLAWKMRTLSFKTRLIELASEINSDMPQYVVRKTASALNDASRAVRGSRVLVLGVAYKKDIDDMRESPALEIIRLLQQEGAHVLYHDPLCPMIEDDGHTRISGLPMRSVPLTDALLELVDMAVIVTDHSAVDYANVARHVPLIVDTRGVMRGIGGRARVVPLSGSQGGPTEAAEVAAPALYAIAG